MPKEIFHWVLAQQVLAGLPDGELRCAIERKVHDYLVGAVIPDAPFFMELSESTTARRLVSSGLRAHGMHGEDTYQPVRNILRCAEGPYEAVVALASGWLVHCAADMTVHPMVHGLCGDYFSKDPEERRRARICHRMMEVRLDTGYWMPWALPNDGFLLISHLRSSLGPGGAARALSAALFAEPSYAQSACKKAVLLQSLGQAVIRWRGLGAVLSRINRTFSLDRDEDLAMWYLWPSNPEVGPEPITFYHPFKGKMVTTTVPEIRTEIVARSISLLRRLGTDLSRMNRGKVGAFRIAGASLETGEVRMAYKTGEFRPELAEPGPFREVFERLCSDREGPC